MVLPEKVKQDKESMQAVTMEKIEVAFEEDRETCLAPILNSYIHQKGKEV